MVMYDELVAAGFGSLSWGLVRVVMFLLEAGLEHSAA